MEGGFNNWHHVAPRILSTTFIPIPTGQVHMINTNRTGKNYQQRYHQVHLYRYQYRQVHRIQRSCTRQLHPSCCHGLGLPLTLLIKGDWLVGWLVSLSSLQKLNFPHHNHFLLGFPLPFLILPDACFIFNCGQTRPWSQPHQSVNFGCKQTCQLS